MKFSILFIYALLIHRSVQVQDFLFFDSGIDKSFVYGGSSWCQPTIPWEKQLQFSGTFANIPQVILTADMYIVGFPVNPVRQVYVKSEITIITTTSFTVKVSCGLQDALVRFEFRWYAFDEKKITVITSNMISNPVDGSIYTHSHTNSEATQGFVYLNSFRFEGNLNFYLELYQMSLYSVKVKIHNSSNNLQELGYTIVIGSPDFIQASGLIDTGLISSTPYIRYYQQINSAPLNAYLLYQITGLQSNTGYLKYQFAQTINTITQISTISLNNWGDSINGCHLYYVWLFQTKQLPLTCKKYRISRKLDPTDNYFTAFYLAELNLLYFNLNNNQQFTVAKDQNVINFALEFVQPSGKKLKAILFKCNECGPINYYQFEKKHTIQQNKVTIYATFQGTQSVEKYFILNISLTSLIIVQRINSAIMTTLVEVLIL